MRLAILALSHVLIDCLLNVVPPLIPFILGRFDWSLAQMATVATVGALTNGLLQPFLGAWVDRLRSAWLVPVTLLWVAGFVVLFSVTNSYVMMLIFAALWGVGGALFHPLGAVVAPRAVPRLRDRPATAMSVFTLGGMLGIALAPVSVTLLVTAWGREGMLVFLVVALLLAASNVLWGVTRIALGPGPSTRPATDSTTPTAVPTITSERKARANIDSGRPWALVRLCTGTTLRLFTFKMLFTFLPLLYIERGFGAAEAGFVLTWFLAIGALGSLMGGHLSDRLGRRVVSVYSSFLLTPALLLALFSSGVAAYAALAVGALAMYSSFSSGIVYAQELAPGRKAAAAGLMTGFVWAIAALFVPVGGALADRFGLEWTMTLMACLPFAAGFVLLTVPETLPVSKRRRTTTAGAV